MRYELGLKPLPIKGLTPSPQVASGPTPFRRPTPLSIRVQFSYHRRPIPPSKRVPLPYTKDQHF